MSKAIYQRMRNITRAKDTWKLRMDGLEIEDIAKKLSTSPNTIKAIIQHTAFSYYSSSIKEEQSYYDTKVIVIREISKQREKLREVIDNIAFKKQVFLRIFETTAVAIALLILI